MKKGLPTPSEDVNLLGRIVRRLTEVRGVGSGGWTNKGVCSRKCVNQSLTQWAASPQVPGHMFWLCYLSPWEVSRWLSFPVCCGTGQAGVCPSSPLWSFLRERSVCGVSVSSWSPEGLPWQAWPLEWTLGGSEVQSGRFLGEQRTLTGGWRSNLGLRLNIASPHVLELHLGSLKGQISLKVILSGERPSTSIRVYKDMNGLLDLSSRMTWCKMAQLWGSSHLNTFLLPTRISPLAFHFYCWCFRNIQKHHQGWEE